jgi:hypothetical protein
MVGEGKMTLKITPQIKVYLEDLAAKGEYGDTPKGVVEAILKEKIEVFLEKGTLERKDGFKRYVKIINLCASAPLR